MIFTGTAAWNIPKEYRSHFPQGDSILERYSRVFPCVEINTSFYREHGAKTYERWRAVTPESFRFSIKLSKLFTHELRLGLNSAQEIELGESLLRIGHLQEKLGVLLVQLPAKLEFSKNTADHFFKRLRKHHLGSVALEPRHPSWAKVDAIHCLNHHGISKVLADPEPCKVSSHLRQSLEKNLRYFRLHGQPQIYKSNYEPDLVTRIAKALLKSEKTKQPTWCIFDNTTFGFATANALSIQQAIGNG